MSRWLETQWHLINSERKHLTFRNLVGVHEAQNNGLIQPVPPVLTWRRGRGHAGRLLKKNQWGTYYVRVRHAFGPADQQRPLWSV